MTATAAARRSWRLDLTADLDAAAGPWEELAERSRNIFLTPAWARAWLATIGDGRGEPIIGTLHDEAGRPRAVIPLVRESRAGLSLLRFLGHGPADELGPVAAPEDEPAAIDYLATMLDHADVAADLFLGERMAEGVDGRWERAEVLQTESSPLVRSEDGWDAYLAGQSRNFRSQVRSRERKLARNHDLHFRLADGADEDLDRLFQLHARRWNGDDTAFGSAEQFHRAFAGTAREQGWMRLWFMEIDGEPVAAWYGFRFAGVESYYQAGRDPERDRESIGFVLLAHSIRAAFEDGLREYRLLRGDERYKDRFATDAAHRQTIAVPRTLAGRSAVRAGRLLLDHGGPLRRVAGALAR
jgi:CelD/BcsL family acetyltransferase involved in cellulose biosynthesis